MRVQQYLFFDGRCEEAFNFYRKAVGAEQVMMMRVKESPEPCQMPPGSDDKILHMQFRIGDTEILASDGHCAGKPVFQGFGLALNATSVADAEKCFGALGEGGQIVMPLTKTFFAKSFGMVTDKFGVMWMVMARE